MTTEQQRGIDGVRRVAPSIAAIPLTRVFAVITFVSLMLGIWVNDGRWSVTGLVFLIAFFVTRHTRRARRGEHTRLRRNRHPES